MQRHLFTSAILETGIYLRQETDVRNGSRFCALEEKSERKRMKTAVVLVMVILLVSGLANVAPTEASGVIVSDKAVWALQLMHLNHEDEGVHGTEYVMLHIEDGVVQFQERSLLKTEDNIYEYRSTLKERYKWMLSRLDEDKCLYVMYNFPYLEQQEGDEAERKSHRILFIVWMPEDAKFKEKMLYASGKNAVKNALHSVYLEIEAFNKDDISYSRVHEKVSKSPE
ncbi:DSTN [Branchiostoma lanceolatum]|uniref:DSTN protein n=1 Tax=Branchiostoma lanceolatum TaxID=7740 RepID=A0A8K0EU33_BRALA|nr:DSTN [Branchiostoma lanceolatum]